MMDNQATPNTANGSDDVEVQPLQSEIVDATEQSVEQWQRISPIAIIYFMMSFFKVMAGNIVYLLPTIVLGYNHMMDNLAIWIPALLGVLALIVVSTFLSYYFFKYRLTNGHIEIRSGVFSKKYVNLPFTRIQNVKLEQPIFYRPFDYTCMQLDTAGSGKQEASVVALKVEFAEELKREILGSHKEAAISEDASTSDNPNSDGQTMNSHEVLLNERSIKDLIIHGLTNNRVWIFLGGLAPFFDNIGRSIVEIGAKFNIDVEQFFTIADKAWWQIGLYAISLTLVIFALITLFSIAGSIISFYGYTLSKSGDRYIRRSGLLTKHEVTMRLSRLQMVVRKQDWLDMLLKRINLVLEQNNTIGAHAQPGAISNKIIVPSIFENECQSLIDDVYPENALAKVSYTRISKRFLIRNLGLFWIPLFAVISAFLIAVGQAPVLIFVVPVFAFVTTLVYMRWYRWGYAKDDKFIYIRKGFFGVDYHCFPIYKVQQAEFQQSWFMRRHQLCSVKFVLASGAIGVPFIREQNGTDIIDETLYIVESSRLSWM